jgi:hypothetical protein
MKVGREWLVSDIEQRARRFFSVRPLCLCVSVVIFS